MKKSILSLLAATVLLCACGDDSEENQQKGSQQTITSIEVTSPALQRAVVSTDDAVRVNWQQADQIGAVGTGLTDSDCEAFTIESGMGTTAATFANTSSHITSLFAVMYPYQPDAAWTNGKLVCEIPSVQTAVAGSFDCRAALMYNIGKESKTTLQYAVNFLKVRVTDNNVHAITINSDEALSGKVEISKTGVTASANAIGSVTLTAGEQRVLNAGEYYIAVKAGNLEQTSISLIYYNPDHTATVKTKAIGTLTFNGAGSVQDISPDFSTGSVTSREAVQLWQDGPYFALCNIGAKQPDEFGEYFAWGETKMQSDSLYEDASYSLCNGTIWGKLTKYCTRATYGIVDGKTTLDPEDDAATANWGYPWRMPNATEIGQLVTRCNNDELHKEWLPINGVNGLKITGLNAYANNSIFLPGGGKVENSLWSRELSYTTGLYWSNTIGYEDHWALFLSFYDMEVYQSIEISNGTRYTGGTVRAVCL